MSEPQRACMMQACEETNTEASVLNTPLDVPLTKLSTPSKLYADPSNSLWGRNPLRVTSGPFASGNSTQQATARRTGTDQPPRAGSSEVESPSDFTSDVNPALLHKIECDRS